MCALTSSGLDDVSDIVTYILFFLYIYIYIFVVEGGGQGRGTLGILGGSFYLSNTLDRTLMTKAKKTTVVATKIQCTDKKEERYTHNVDEGDIASGSETKIQAIFNGTCLSPNIQKSIRKNSYYS